jgi:hypothetical protein
MPSEGRKPKRRRKRAGNGPRSRFDDLPLWPEKVEGGKLVRMLEKHVGGLREEDAHGNRELFLDDVFLVHLLAFFNPSIRSLRTYDDFSQTKQAQRHLATGRISRSTLSDFHKFADPERLRPLIAELRAEVSRKFAGRPPSDLQSLLKQVLAVDGTFFAAAADVAWAVGHRNKTATRYRARTDWHVDVGTWLPEVVAVPEPNEGEAHSAAHHITPNAIHIYDRGIASHELLAAHYTTVSDEWTPRAQFVLRMKKPGGGIGFLSVEERPLGVDAKASGVTSDRVGHLSLESGLPITVREITVLRDNAEPLRLLTNLLDVEPEIVALLYRYRWQIELFFRWLKCYAHFDHLISYSSSGVLLNFYVVVIGVLLMYLHTGGRPSKYAFVLLSMVGPDCSLADIMPILRERERQCEVARQGAARRRARKQAESR